MIHLEVLEVLRNNYPDSVTPGQIQGQLLEVHHTATREQVVSTLNQLKEHGMAKESYDNEWVATS